MVDPSIHELLLLIIIIIYLLTGGQSMFQIKNRLFYSCVVAQPLVWSEAEGDPNPNPNP